MKKAIVSSSTGVLIILSILALVSCSGGGTSNSGTLEMSLTDGTGSFQAVYDTISEEQVHHETDGWITLTDLNLILPQTLNLRQKVLATGSFVSRKNPQRMASSRM